MMWGTLPFGTCILAMLVVLIPQRRRCAIHADVPIAADRELVPGRLAS